MSDYTTQIRWLRETNYDFGLSNYPIFDENYRTILNDKILNHYNFREIGFETAGLFKFYLNSTMNEIMPKYNQMYELKLDKTNLFSNINLTEEYIKENAGESIGSSDGTQKLINHDRIVDSSTPQALLKMESIENEVYASSASINDSENDGENYTISENKINNTENYLKTIVGNNGRLYYHEIFLAIRNSLIDIDTMIIEDLSNLFMLIY